MGWATTCAVALNGVAGSLIQVEADVSPGLPAFTLSGLPDAACRQSADRIRAGSANCEVAWPQRRVTVNLSPASVPKGGSSLDLAIAVAIFGAVGAIAPSSLAEVMHVGEVGLDGSVRGVTGVLPQVIAAVGACQACVVPADNYAEACLVPGITVYPVRNLRDVLAVHEARAEGRQHHVPTPVIQPAAPPALPDLAHVVGQSQARRALEIAAAGGHHIALIGPPGAGKTLLAQCLPSLLPGLDEQESMEVTAIHSAAGMLTTPSLITSAPWVAPHHSATIAALVGGGSGQVRPGLITLAHRGVLFLDESPEFASSALQTLRQPLESGHIVVSRARQTSTFPAAFQLVMAANPCPCGMSFGDASRCTCTVRARMEYFARIGGPVADRVDVWVRMLPLKASMVHGVSAQENSAQVAARVAEARDRQRVRWKGSGAVRNSQVPGSLLRSARYRLPRSVTQVVDAALDRGKISLRGYDRVLRMAWTIADLGQVEVPTFDEVCEAVVMRQDEQQ